MIRRVNLDGTDIEVVQFAFEPQAIQVDILEKKTYWINLVDSVFGKNSVWLQH